MSDLKPLPRPRPAPPRIDESKVSQPLQDLFAGWRVALKEPFVGLTADGAVEPDLFALEQTGASTRPLAAATDAFLASFSDAQRKAVSFDVDGEVWRTWSNIHRNLMRHGLCMAELSESQRALAYGVLRAGLGPRAYETARNAMRLNETLAEMTGIPEEFGEYFYWISIFGEPSADAPWGWQMDGHHCNINCFVLGEQIVLSPMLLGSEPVAAEDGVYKGLTVLREEEAEGWAFMAALTPGQRARAIVDTELPFDGYASGFKDNLVAAYAGMPAADMSAEQRARLTALLALYTDRLPASHAPLRFDEVTAHLDRTWFGWIGDFNETAPFYYRIHSPVIFVEFYHQPGVALPNTGYNRRHAHALVRTPNGNDYGRALLRAYRARQAT